MCTQTSKLFDRKKKFYSTYFSFVFTKNTTTSIRANKLIESVKTILTNLSVSTYNNRNTINAFSCFACVPMFDHELWFSWVACVAVERFRISESPVGLWRHNSLFGKKANAVLVLESLLKTSPDTMYLRTKPAFDVDYFSNQTWSGVVSDWRIHKYKHKAWVNDAKMGTRTTAQISLFIRVGKSTSVKSPLF